MYEEQCGEDACWFGGLKDQINMCKPMPLSKFCVVQIVSL